MYPVVSFFSIKKLSFFRIAVAHASNTSTRESDGVGLLEFTASLVYRVSARIVKATQKKQI